MNRFEHTTKQQEMPVSDIASFLVPISRQKVEYSITDYALFNESELDRFFPSMFKNGKLNKTYKWKLVEDNES